MSFERAARIVGWMIVGYVTLAVVAFGGCAALCGR